MRTTLTTAGLLALAVFAAATTAAIGRIRTDLQSLHHTVALLEHRPLAAATDFKTAAGARVYTSTDWKTISR